MDDLVDAPSASVIADSLEKQTLMRSGRTSSGGEDVACATIDSNKAIVSVQSVELDIILIVIEKNWRESLDDLARRGGPVLDFDCPRRIGRLDRFRLDVDSGSVR